MTSAFVVCKHGTDSGPQKMESAPGVLAMLWRRRLPEALMRVSTLMLDAWSCRLDLAGAAARTMTVTSSTVTPEMPAIG